MSIRSRKRARRGQRVYSTSAVVKKTTTAKSPKKAPKTKASQ
jgi:hypothetical protein